MFREVSRKKQALTREECVRLLKAEKRGVLSVLGDDGYPYGLPMNHFYSEEDGKLYFHSGLSGHKIDAMARCDRASFCVYDGGEKREGDWALYVRSVIVFGRLRVEEDRERMYDMIRRLSHKFTSDDGYIEYEIEKDGPGTLFFSLTPEHITGKLVHEK